MTEIKLFEAQRTDPTKIEEGVWIEHPETNDRFKVRKHLGTQHLAAYLAEVQAYEAKHGENSHLTEEGERHCEAVGLASGLIVDWDLKNYPDAEYDAAFMAATLADPEKSEVVSWFRLSTSGRERFKPDAAELVGNESEAT